MTTTLNLSVGDPDARVRLETAVDALLAERRDAPTLTVALSGSALPAETVAMLVSMLRRLRERGGALAVDATTPELRDAMALHGLDRVFALPLDPDGGRRPTRRHWLPRMATAAVATVAVLAALWPAGVSAQPATQATDPAAVLARVIERNPTLSSYQGRLHVDIRLISFPFIRQHLDATTYYKRPSNYEVVFDKLPSYAKGFEKLYTDIGDPANWEKRFFITLDGEIEFEHHRDIALRMVQRVRGMIDHETVLVNPNTWTIDQIRYDYYNGGSITMSQHFETIGGYSLLVSQRAEIAIPHVRAIANGSYADYQTNVAVDDSVFPEEQQLMLAPQRTLTGVEETRSRILAATREIFERNGTRGTTTREVAERAGVNEATLFRHFGSKAALIGAMREDACGFEAFRSVLSGLDGADLASDIRTLAHLAVEKMAKQRALMCIALAEDAIEASPPDFDAPEWRGPRGMLELLTEYFAARVAENRVAGDPDLLARALMGLLFQLIVARKLWGAAPIETETTDALVDIYLNGVLR